MAPDHVEAILYRLDRQDKEMADSRTELRIRLEAIDTKVAATNGRVKTLELWQAKLDGAGLVVNKLGPLVTGSLGAVIGAVITHLLS